MTIYKYRRVGNWRKCIQDCERAKRASRFFKISALKTYDSSQISILLINHCLSVQYVHDCVRNTPDMVLFIILTIENKKLEKNYIERAERASQNFCTFVSEKCFTYRPETREKAINDCDLRASQFLCVSETCDSSQ